MSDFLSWAEQKAKTTNVEQIDYEGETYQAEYKEICGTLPAGRIRALREQYGSTPVCDEFKQVRCYWGGKYISEATRFRVYIVTFTRL